MKPSNWLLECREYCLEVYFKVLLDPLIEKNIRTSITNHSISKYTINIHMYVRMYVYIPSNSLYVGMLCVSVLNAYILMYDN